MVEVRPDEISAILTQELANVDTAAQLEEVGTVLQVGDGIARSLWINSSKSRRIVEFENGVKAIVLNLEEDNVGVVLMGPSEGIKEGDTVKRTNKLHLLK
jgi:F-type H+-transporting ATPase subunit alpha